MRFKNNFILKVIDDQQKEMCTLNHGGALSYDECKSEIIKEMKTLLTDAPYLFSGNFYLVVTTTDLELYQCILYKWLYAQYCIDESKDKKAFSFLLDCLFVFGEWTITNKVPDNLFCDLIDQIRADSDQNKATADISKFKWGDPEKVKSQKVINGKTMQEWAQKQQEYDKQRLELVKEWHQE